MISINGLTVAYGGFTLLDDINFHISENDKIGLVGKNGAGKSTILKLICGLQSPTSGKVAVPSGIKIGYLPQEIDLYPNLTLQECLEYMGALSGIPKDKCRERIRYYLEKTSLTEHRKKRMRQLSGGMKRRAGLIQALLNEPEFLIVDEPTTGLDPEERIRIRNLLVDFSENRNVRKFVQLADKCGLQVSLRIGPWCHGEVRNGGFPDWLLHKAEREGFRLRTDDAGYLAEVDLDNYKEALDLLFSGTPDIEERMMLCGTFTGGEDLAMNDIVLAREGKIRIINFNIYVDGSLLNSYHADGVIISTPTGSTGYNLSAGGPIVEPTAQMIVVTPICSHALNTSSIVLSADDTIEVEIGEGRYGRQEKVSLCFDGAEQITLVTGDRVVIRRSDRTARLIKLESESFMKTLRRKMKGN